MSIMRPPNPLSRPGRRSTEPAVPKLRDTCDGCAASKVKCDKKKPTCSRCAKRGVVCEYLVTKRSGRRHESRQSDPSTITQASSISSSTTNSSSMPSNTQPSPRLRVMSDDIENLPTMLSPGDSVSWWMPSDMRPAFNELFDSSITFQEVKHPKAGEEPNLPQSGSSSINLQQSSNDTAALDHPKDMSVIMEDILESPLLLSESQSNAYGFQNAHAGDACCCLLQALSLFKRSLRNSATACMCLRGQKAHSTCQLPTVQVVFAENEETIVAINNMLQCPCSHGGYILVIIALIVFKILGWYTAAAKATSQEEEAPEETEMRCASSCHSERVVQCPTVVDSDSLDDEDHGRIAAQQVLSELHRMQKLVNDLSGRLKTAEHQDHTRGVDPISPFSSAMLNQLDIDLRTRLRVLYLEIVDLATRVIY